MVCLDSSISVQLNPNPSSTSTMSNCNHYHPKLKIRNPKCNSIGSQKIQSCDDWHFVIIDVVLLIAVVGAFGCLLFPYAKILTLGLVGIVRVGFSLVKEEVAYAPGLYTSLALGMICASVASLTILISMDTNCGRPGCRGLRKTGTFDIQVQTKEDLRNLSSNVVSSSVKDVVKEGMSRFRREHIRELELRLRKMAPSNGKAVLVYRSGCGCIAGKLEVSGPRSLPSRGKIKKTLGFGSP